MQTYIAPFLSSKRFTCKILYSINTTKSSLNIARLGKPQMKGCSAALTLCPCEHGEVFCPGRICSDEGPTLKFFQIGEKL